MSTGDFFHSRGSIPVPLLNSLCSTLSHSHWTSTPTIMIPGNHDQITLSGSSHSLQFLETIMPKCRVIDEPTILLNAAFVPYRRDPNIWKKDIPELINNHTSPIKALFVHADVKGAKMNSNYTSKSELTLSQFPPVPIYSGHFHLPQTLKSKNKSKNNKITYIGSPYQQSFSEAGDVKRFLVLNKEFEVKESLEVGRVGREYFIGLENVGECVEGDVVRVDIVEGDTEAEENVKPHIQNLKDKGVDVIIRRIQRTKNNPTPLINEPPNASMSDSETTLSFLSSLNYTSESPIHSKVLSTLNNVTSTSKPSRVNLELSEIDLKGFASFKSKQEYPLGSRGLVLLKGGGSSNGVGKTSLAWAGMWALTGQLDERAVNDASVVSIINDGSKNAEVTLRGKVNEREFVVSRSKTKTKTRLSFFVDGKDETLQTAKDTQEVINEMCGSYSTLSRCVFLNQFMSGDMLSGSDSSLLEALSKLADVDKFREARKICSEEARELQKERLSLEGGLSVRINDERIAMERVEEMENLVVTDSFAAQPSTPALTLINEELEEATAELDRFKEDKIGDEDLKRLQSEIEAADSAFRATKDAVWMSEKELEMLQSTDIAHSDGENCPTCGQTIDGDAEIQLAKTKKEIASKMEALEVSFTAAAEEVTKNSALLESIQQQHQTLSISHDTKITTASQKVSSLRSKISSAVVSSAALQKLEAAISGLESAKSKASKLTSDVKSMKAKIERLQSAETIATTSMSLFSSRGIQQYVLSDTFTSLSSYTTGYLSSLSVDTLRLNLTCEDGVKIGRTVEVYENGSWISRSLGSLSGGQYRRCSLGLMFGYREMSRKWGNFKSNLLVLDEPLTHLDTEGRRRVGRVLKGVVGEEGTVLCILQDKAAEEMEASADEIDVVERDGEGGSSVLIDGDVKLDL